MIFRLFARRTPRVPLSLYNTLGKEKQVFTSLPHQKTVRMYNCGPTVYGTQHIGNLSMFVFTDIVRRTLEYNDMPVKQVINFTDFGHLTGENSGNADEGEDKMMKGLKRDGFAVTMENMRTMAHKYADIFTEDLRKLGIDTSRITFPYASEYIPAQIAMVQTLEEKGYVYRLADGLYFETARFPAYGALGGINDGNKEGARVATVEGKRNAADFALWKFAEKDSVLGWDSPWGRGFPGWHIECSAMIRKLLGEQIDIHTGGIEHIPIHHNNEIAQSECCSGKKPFSRFWMHRGHLQLEGGKFAKSEGRVLYLSELIEKGFHPLAFRYLLLGSHYRSSANFTWEAMEAAQTAFLRLRRMVDSIEEKPSKTPEEYRSRWHERINDDLDTPGALAVLWDMIGKAERVQPAELKAGIIEMDRVFGLGLNAPDTLASELCAKIFGTFVPSEQLPERIRTLVEARDNARKAKEWQSADSLRKEVERLGYVMEDSPTGARVFRKS